MVKLKSSASLFRIIIALVFILLVVGFYFNSQQNSEIEKKIVDEESNEAKEYLSVDFEGTGKPMKLEIRTSEKNINVYDASGKEITFNSAAPISLSNYKVIKLNDNSPKEYIQWDNVVGPHQTQTFFFTFFEGKLQAMPYFDFENDKYSYAFYNSRGELGVGDFTSDELLDVISNVDEYPIDGPWMDEKVAREIVFETFKDEKLSEEEAQNLVKIVSRENNGNGRGNIVIGGIYSFVESEAPFFRKLREDEYNEVADRYITAMNTLFKEQKMDSKLMKVSELDPDSINFNYFVRDFWTRGNNFEFSIEKE